jgi:hypothetical protein
VWRRKKPDESLARYAPRILNSTLKTQPGNIDRSSSLEF